jgi:hypothetical protein
MLRMLQCCTAAVLFVDGATVSAIDTCSRASLLRQKSLANNLSFSLNHFWKKVRTHFVLILDASSHVTLVPTAGTAEIIRECAAGIHRSDSHLNFWLEIQETNFNVSVSLHSKCRSMVTDNSRATVTLLHPYDVTRARELRLCTSSPQHATAENFMTSKQLDEFCCNGKYYVSC